MEIKTNTIGQAHIKICKEILEEGVEVITEDNERTLELREPLLIIIKEPLSEPMISSICGFGQLAFDKYTEDLIEGSNNGFAYTYHERLYEHESAFHDLQGEGVGEVDQISDIISKLKSEPNSRRAQAITWYPSRDMESDSPPCLQRVQCIIRDNKLNMHVTFRSNDCLSAFNQNAYALVNLQNYIAEVLDVGVGIYTHYITCPHIYHIRDKYEIDKLKLEVYK